MHQATAFHECLSQAHLKLRRLSRKLLSVVVAAGTITVCLNGTPVMAQADRSVAERESIGPDPEPEAKARADGRRKADSHMTAKEAGFDNVRLFAAAGSGFPDLFHGELGFFVTDHVSVEGRIDWMLLNPMVGLAATCSLGPTYIGRPPKHAFLVHTQVMVNPTLGGLLLESEGDTLASALGLYIGYGFLGTHGLYARALGGGFVYADDGPAAGLNLTIGVGYAF